MNTVLSCRMLAVLAVSLVLGGGARALGDSIVYDDGPIDGHEGAWAIAGAVSDSFTVASSVDLKAAQIGAWIGSGGVPVSVEWSIGTTASGAQISSGTASLANTFQYPVYYAGGYYDIYESTLLLSGAVSAGTTYWFTLKNAVSTPGGWVYWDVNHGPSLAWAGGGYSPGESFQLYGLPEAVPDSPTYAVFFSLGLFSFAVWRDPRSKAA